MSSDRQRYHSDSDWSLIESTVHIWSARAVQREFQDCCCARVQRLLETYQKAIRSYLRQMHVELLHAVQNDAQPVTSIRRRRVDDELKLTFNGQFGDGKFQCRLDPQ